VHFFGFDYSSLLLSGTVVSGTVDVVVTGAVATTGGATTGAVATTGGATTGTLATTGGATTGGATGAGADTVGAVSTTVGVGTVGAGVVARDVGKYADISGVDVVGRAVIISARVSVFCGKDVGK